MFSGRGLRRSAASCQTKFEEVLGAALGVEPSAGGVVQDRPGDRLELVVGGMLAAPSPPPLSPLM